MEVWQKKQLKDNWADLDENIQPKELLGHLFAAEVITFQQKNDIQEQRGMEKLLNILYTGSSASYEAFCRALNTTGQQHIVKKWLTCPPDEAKGANKDNPSTSEGGVHANFEKRSESDDVLLTKEHKRLLKRNKRRLIDNLRLDDVLTAMEVAEIFSDVDVQRIKATIGIGPNKMNEVFLDTLEKTSEGGFNVFVEALEEYQPALAKILKE